MKLLPGSMRHDYDPDSGGSTVVAAYVCDACGRPSVAQWQDDVPPEFAGETRDPLPSDQWWPDAAAGKEFPDVPKPIAAAASEAHLCLSVNALRGACALARAVVEACAKERGITEGRLYSKITALHDKGLIREDIKAAAHEIRHFGNGAAHGDLTDPTSPEEAAAILELMDELLHELYQTPATVARLRSARQADTTPAVGM